ncbi:MAG: hypothetical protein KAS23_07555 [Anaerohalosphaera sp.]|nr:hypothetical protein [Anaerohalosphaera sp.]
MSDTQPYLIQDVEASGRKLSQLPAKKKAFSEDWLQQLLHKHTDILPLDDFGEGFTPAISIGREIANIDNLFVSPSGLITIVETKLWRNPEGHRTVVAQILDYAKTLSKWTYQELDKAVQKCSERMDGKPKKLYQFVMNKLDGEGIDEIEFQEKVQQTLETGKFALLIVGDRIHPSATQLAEIIQSAPHMQYSLAFVELNCYRLEKKSDWPLVVVPTIVQKTKEVTRAVVKVVYEEKKPEIDVVTPKEKITSTGRTNESEFLAFLPSELKDLFESHISNWTEIGYTIYWGTVGFSLRLNFKGKLRTIFEAYPDSLAIYQEKRLAKDMLPQESYAEYKSQLLNSSVIGSAYANERRYLNYKDLSKDDIELVIRSTDSWVKAIMLSS